MQYRITAFANFMLELESFYFIFFSLFLNRTLNKNLMVVFHFLILQANMFTRIVLLCLVVLAFVECKVCDARIYCTLQYTSWIAKQ